ncbi:hypothetical protein GPA27_16395 [Aromatoleum toluolicum]|uniref:Helix-turn-helix domain-containing protein n=1 Tax=Aromatoleum toluolicum TaxID=90060 RepID=A0ABX1NIN6_9RHOO|nr:hypothetical protein [Aromatoleum toluolicum]NMF98960.1 hypothetical protein [Aromatoleum toluolicum]
MGFFFALVGGAVNTDQVLQHLQAQYPGQFVLYAPDLAKILGKSEKALAHLITRGQLPFHVKSLGGRKCVDIYQVAQWLAADAGAEDTPEPNKPGSTPRKPRPKSASGAGQPGKKAGKSTIGARLMEMRYSAAMAVSRWAGAGPGDDEVRFCHELADALLNLPGRTAATLSANCTRWRPHGHLSMREELKTSLDGADGVRQFIQLCKEEARGCTAATLAVRRGRNLMYRAHYLPDTGWTVLVDEVK